MDELVYQYGNAAKLWSAVACALSDAVLQISERKQLMDFQLKTWENLYSLQQQAGIYWELAEEGFQTYMGGKEPAGQRFQEIMLLREAASNADRWCYKTTVAFLRLCNHLKKHPFISGDKKEEVCLSVFP